MLLVGDLAKNGKRQFLAANVVPKTPKNNVPGTVITRAVVAQDDDGKWTELLRCDEHLKNQKGYLGLTPLDSINGWRLQFEQNAEKGLQLYFTPLKVNGDTHVLPVGVRWNPATKRYQSLDASYEKFPEGIDVARKCEVHSAMSAAATSSAALGIKLQCQEPPKVSAWKNLRGLFPYLRRYKGGLALGLFALALMGIVGNVVPLATGIIIDVLAGSARPFSNGVGDWCAAGLVGSAR